MKTDFLRLRFLATVRSKSDPGGDPSEVAFLPMEAVGDRGDFDRESIRSRSEIGSGYTYFEDGDVVRAKVTPCFENGKGAVLSGLAGGCGFGSTELLALRPLPGVERRFLYYVLTSHEFTAHGTGYLYGAHGVKRVPEKFFRDFVAWSPPESMQRLIADHLDRETGWIDALIQKKRRMVELVEARWQGLLESTIRGLSATWGEKPLKHECREIVVGIVITPSAWYAENGVPAIRGLNVAPGRISAEELVYLTPEGDALHAKSRLRSRDVVIVRTGQAGAAAVVPPWLEGANCIDLVIVRPKPSLSSEYLELVLNSDWMQKHIQEHMVGTIQGHFNVSAAKSVPIPVPSREEQETVEVELHASRRSRDVLIGHLESQIHLLGERRKALITAAVTGKLDIAEAA